MLVSVFPVALTVHGLTRTCPFVLEERGSTQLGTIGSNWEPCCVPTCDHTIVRPCVKGSDGQTSRRGSCENARVCRGGIPGLAKRALGLVAGTIRPKSHLSRRRKIFKFGRSDSIGCTPRRSRHGDRNWHFQQHVDRYTLIPDSSSPLRVNNDRRWLLNRWKRSTGPVNQIVDKVKLYHDASDNRLRHGIHQTDASIHFIE